MGKLIAVVGNLGAGKTTFAKLICAQGAFIPYWERPDERPFQTDIAQDLSRWALANQMDFFLFRCRQELLARQSQDVSVFDGGFDQDFHVFTRHLYNRGHLTQAEFDVCQRYYHFARQLLPAPDLVIRIMVDMPTLLQRRASRGRETVDQSFRAQEFTDLERLLDEWLECEVKLPVIRFTFERNSRDYTDDIEALVAQIKNSLQST
jgi:deoxyadenosine/deoxycytidine kinase